MSPTYLQEREKVQDGYMVLCWPEFHALFARLHSVPEVPQQYKVAGGLQGIELNVKLEEVTLKVFKYKEPHEFVTLPFTGFDMFQTWPEYKALRERLGVTFDVYEVECWFRFVEGEMPLIRQTYAPAQPRLTDEPKVVHAAA